MFNFPRWKIFSIIGTVLVSCIIALPNLFSKSQLESLPAFLPHHQMPLGLDLQGGAHLLLGMDSDQLRKDWLANIREDARKVLRDAKNFPKTVNVVGGTVQVTLVEPTKLDDAVKELRKLQQQVGNAVLGSSGPDIEVNKSDSGVITMTPTQPGFLQRQTNTIASAIETVNRRINALGTAESTVVRQGRDRILVQFPGVQDTSQLKAILGKTAKLTFHEVHPTMTAEEAQQGRPPVGYRLFPSERSAEGSVLLRETPVVQGDELTDAQPGQDSRTGEWIISFRFNQVGARKFGRFTQENVGRPFAIVLDDKVLSAPVIREPILGGSGQISGSFTADSATTLAVSLRSGALPTKLTIVEERTVGPSLGSDSIAAGKIAGIIGGVATIVLTVLAYGTFGIFACIGLLVHLVSTVALMTLFGSTLTLPGIAGLVLGVAMAVDANVLIYERIREELRAGKSPMMAINEGFDRAFITIADSQLTTLACAIVMFWLGSGPIRGFAITLAFGILTSIFSSVTVVRLLIHFWLKTKTRDRRSFAVPI